jgi:hypothetical protein
VALTSALSVGYLALCVWFRLAVSSTSEVRESTTVTGMLETGEVPA